MREEVSKQLNLLVQNTEIMKETLKLESAGIQTALAQMFTSQQLVANGERITECKKILRQNAGIFSSLRGNSEALISSVMSLSNDPEQMLNQIQAVLPAIKKIAGDSYYVPLSALILVQNAKESEYDAILEKVFVLYKSMKKSHPWITDGEDVPLCTMLALSDRSADQILEEVESSHNYMLKTFKTIKTRNTIQAISHIISLYEGESSAKCNKVIALAQKLIDAGVKFDKDSCMPSIALLAMSTDDYDTIVKEVIENDQWLSEHKNFSNWRIGRDQRIIFALTALMNPEKFVSASDVNMINNVIAIMVAELMTAIMLMTITTATINTTC